jgi:hypothetical protein
MSTLQCPATLLLAPSSAVLPTGLRVTNEWAPDEALLSDDVPTLRAALSEIADQSPGETTLVPVLDDRLRTALPRLARIDVHPDRLRDASLLALEIDADDWVVSAAYDGA